MTTPAIYVREDASLQEAIVRALREGVRAVPVLNAASQVIGMITDKDLSRGGLTTNLRQLQQMEASERAPYLEQAAAIPVRQVMSQPVHTVPYQATVAKALTLMREHDVKRLPVVDQAGHLAGLLTRSDILRELAFDEVKSGTPAGFFDWDVRVDEVELEPAVTVTPTTTLPTLIQQMQAALQLRAVVVNELGQAIGMISEADLLTRIPKEQRAGVITALRNQGRLAQLDLAQTAGELMTTPVITVNQASGVFEAIQLLIDNQIKRLPVLDQAGKVLGLVSRRTLLYALVRAPKPA